MTKIFVWGKASSGQLALGGIEEDSISIPEEVPHYEGFSKKVLDVACGWEHTAFLTSDGMVYTCGSNDFGQLGQTKSLVRPERIDALETMTIRKVVCGQNFTMALTNKGRLLSWGNNSSGQLGHTIATEIIQRPRNIKFFNDLPVIQVSCGMHHSLALTYDGRLYSWGSNSHGQLGVGRTTSSASPEVPHLVSALLGLPLADISAGGYHSMALGFSGAVFGWGKNSFGQLGLDNGTDQVFPVQIESIRTQRVRRIVCGEDHTAVLTEDGGVFTFGAGTDGQLGHNSNSHQNQPLKVLELMGTLITQIDCGRRHTLAFAPTSGRVYAFGLGACGQLGFGTTVSYNSPISTKGPWLPSSGETTAVKKIIAGGDHCFVLATTRDSTTTPLDMRLLSPSNLLCVIYSDMVEDMQGGLHNNTISLEVLKKLETIFSNQQCLNGSFFNTKKNQVSDFHHHAVDLSSVRKFFQALSKHETANEMILNSLERNLIPSLAEAPADLDGLRVYVILPEFEMFRVGARYKTLAVPFAKKLLATHTRSLTVVGNWWAKLPPTYFEGIIKIFQECVKYILKETINQLDKAEFTLREQCLRTSLEVLEGLNKVNDRSENPVSYTAFYIPELTESLDLKSDFIRWIEIEMGHSNQSSKSTLSFCKYPFVFDSTAKYKLLQTDANLQMQSAFQEAHHANIGNLLFNGLQGMVSPVLLLRVKRESIVQDTLSQVVRLGPMDYKKPLQVSFVDEQAVDAGGVKKEFFLLLMKEILDPKYGMFKTIEENNLIWFNKQVCLSIILQSKTL